ncbi:MAG: hypothetical protein HZY73_10345 [Micropruina sp.]|nr:MAG: hypothetical protein HZY73_10345 [Micropruina sp.]
MPDASTAWTPPGTGTCRTSPAASPSISATPAQPSSSWRTCTATASPPHPRPSGHRQLHRSRRLRPPETTTSGAARYGWLGTHQRDNSAVGGLTLMGARLYNPTSGRFLSIDPVDAGNDNRYVYPPDPIGKTDLSGLFFMAWLNGTLAPSQPKEFGSALAGVSCSCYLTGTSLVSL